MWVRAEAKPWVILIEQDREADLEISGRKGPRGSFVVRFLPLFWRNRRPLVPTIPVS